MLNDPICAVDLIPSGGAAQYRVDVTTLRDAEESIWFRGGRAGVRVPTYRKVTETIYLGDNYKAAMAVAEHWAAKMNAQRTPPPAPQEPVQ